MSGPRFYPGDPVPGGTEQRPFIHLELRDGLGRPLSGEAYIRDVVTDESLTVPVEDGVLHTQVELGTYRVLAVLRDAEGKVYYRQERVTV